MSDIVKAILRDHVGGAAADAPEDTLLAELMDSLEFDQVVMEIEERTGRDIDIARSDACRTIGDLYRLAA